MRDDIKFVFLDVGGVALLDFSGTDNWKEMKKSLGISKKFDSIFEKEFENYVKEIDRGMPLEEFTQKLKDRVNIDLTNRDLIKEFVDRFLPNTSIHSIMNVIKQNMGIGLLTNMYVRMLDLIFERNLMPNISYDVIIDSSIERVAKPDREIYMRSEKMSGFSGSEILFIDNTQENLDEAKKFNWQVFLYDPSNYINSSEKLYSFLEIK